MPYASAGVRGVRRVECRCCTGIRRGKAARGRPRPLLLGGEATRRHYVFADSSGAVVIPDVQIEEVR